MLRRPLRPVTTPSAAVQGSRSVQLRIRSARAEVTGRTFSPYGVGTHERMRKSEQQSSGWHDPGPASARRYAQVVQARWPAHVWRRSQRGSVEGGEQPLCVLHRFQAHGIAAREAAVQRHYPVQRRRLISGRDMTSGEFRRTHPFSRACVTAE
jgi:hypothetical protein